MSESSNKNTPEITTSDPSETCQPTVPVLNEPTNNPIESTDIESIKEATEASEPPVIETPSTPEDKSEDSDARDSRASTPQGKLLRSNLIPKQGLLGSSFPMPSSQWMRSQTNLADLSTVPKSQIASALSLKKESKDDENDTENGQKDDSTVTEPGEQIAADFRIKTGTLNPPQPTTPKPKTPSSKPQPVTPAVYESTVKEHEMQETLHQAIVHDFESLMKELENDETMQPFKKEYEKMFKAILKSKDRGEKLYGQFVNLHTEFMSNQNAVEDSLKNQIQDDQTLKSLKEQIAAAEKQLEENLKKEETTKEELRLIKQDITQLSTTLKQGVGLSVVQERNLNDLIQAKEQSTKELEHELDKIVKLRNEISEISEKIKTTDMNKRDLERRIYDLKEKNSQKKADIDTEMRMKERLERELRELRVVVAIKTQEVRGRQDAVNRASDDISILESQIKSQRQMLEKLLKDQENLTTRTGKLQQDCDEQTALTNEIVEENQQMARDLKIKEADLLKNRNEVKRINKIKDTLIKKNRALEEQKTEADANRKELRAKNEAMLIEIENLRKNTEADKRIVDDLAREKEILEENLSKAQTETQKSEILTSLHRQTWHNLELELQRYRKEANEHSKIVKQLQDDRDIYVAESMRLQALCVQGLQAIKEKELEIFDYKRKMVQADTKLKHQQNLYEAVQSDRNLHSKHLIESQTEISGMKRKLKVMNFQINGLKEDINSKDEAFIREVNENQKLIKDYDIITEEIQTLKKQNELAQTYIRQQLAEEVKLNQFVKEADMERTRQENAIQVLISERDNLSSQLIRQNEELTKVYDRIKTQQSSLIRSENHYKERVKTISQIHEEIVKLKSQKRFLSQDTSKVNLMKHTICRLRSELIREQTRMKALEEELQNPVNVHRWRKLEGSNPQAYEMIQLLHSLQKKLIEKTQENSQKEALIQQQEETYLRLKAILGKQIGPEALEQVSEYQQILKDKTMQMKHMGTELNMYQAQVREYRYAVFQLDKALGEVRNLYIRTARGKLREKTDTPNELPLNLNTFNQLPPLPAVQSKSNVDLMLEENEPDHNSPDNTFEATTESENQNSISDAQPNDIVDEDANTTVMMFNFSGANEIISKDQEKNDRTAEEIDNLMNSENQKIEALETLLTNNDNDTTQNQ
ncbi:hypothetical protein HK098_002667 [Nowakowskiella sp. JEL0407]|nr:hypothetical protein HK098_002667 [Nowakowskiella sp. JEL0407]